MEKLVVIDACVREKDSRTWRIASPIVEELSKRYETALFHLPRMKMEPLDPESYKERTEGKHPSWAEEAAREIASCDRMVIASPFWDMSIPALLKTFIERTSLFGITFDSNDSTCLGLCRCKKVLFITTRGMNIHDGDPLDCGLPYIRAISSLWGLGEVECISECNMDYVSEQEIERKIEDAVSRGLKLAKEF